MDQKSKTAFGKPLPFYFLWLILPGLSFLFLYLFRRKAEWAELYARELFPKIVFLPRHLVRLFPFSLLAVLILGGGAALLFFLFRFLYRLIKGPDRRALGRRFLIVLIVFVSVITPLYYLNFGYTYHRFALPDNLGLSLKPSSKEDLYHAGLWIGEELEDLSVEVKRDETGLFVPSLSKRQIYREAGLAYANIAEISDNPFIKASVYHGPVLVKPMPEPLSYLWSYTGITGIYFPFLVESTVNSHVRPDERLATVLHEVAHSYGFAREEEANFFSFYAGIHHPDMDFRYAAWLHAYIHVSNALYKEDKNLHNALWESLPPGVQADLRARNIYWDRFEGKVQEVSTQINDFYLKSNGQSSGVKSYGEVVDLILAYYKEESGFR